MVKRVRLSIAGLLLAGCSSVSAPHPFADQAAAAQILRLDYCIASTATQNTFSRRFGKKENPEQFAAAIKLAIADIETYAKEHLTESGSLRLTYVSPCPQLKDKPDPHADLFLAVELSGYGSVKSRWKTWLIATGILEGIAQGIAVSAATGDSLLAIGVAAEEMVSEYLTWNGVDWLLGETYAPVTLEGRLVSTRDGKTVWRHTYFVRSNEKELKGLSKEAKKVKSVQLQASLHKAERKLFDNFSMYLENEIANSLKATSTSALLAFGPVAGQFSAGVHHEITRFEEVSADQELILEIAPVN